MNISDRLPFLFVVAFLVGGGGLIISQYFWSGESDQSVKVTVPELSQMARAGQESFEKNCAMCHGKTAGGSDQGPPLIHRIYEPGHHADQSFVFAIRRGARQHHWGFGNMPPRPEVTEGEIPKIIRFVRELQAANGVY